MKDLNRVELIGRLGSDPELKYTQEGKPVATLTVATGRQWKGEGGEAKEQIEWSRCSGWGRIAEIAAEFLHKGDRVFVEGRLKTSKWEDEQGITRYTTEIVLADLIMLGKATGSSSSQEPAEEAAADPTPVIPSSDNHFRYHQVRHTEK